jgi:hypothetical protein
MSGLLVEMTISIDRGLLRTKKPLNQGCLVVKLKSSLLKKKKQQIPNVYSGGFRGGRAGRAPPLKFAKHMLYNVN